MTALLLVAAFALQLWKGPAYGGSGQSSAAPLLQGSLTLARPGGAALLLVQPVGWTLLVASSSDPSSGLPTGWACLATSAFAPGWSPAPSGRLRGVRFTGEQVEDDGRAAGSCGCSDSTPPAAATSGGSGSHALQSALRSASDAGPAAHNRLAGGLLLGGMQLDAPGSSGFVVAAWQACGAMQLTCVSQQGEHTATQHIAPPASSCGCSSGANGSGGGTSSLAAALQQGSSSGAPAYVVAAAGAAAWDSTSGGMVLVSSSTCPAASSSSRGGATSLLREASSSSSCGRGGARVLHLQSTAVLPSPLVRGWWASPWAEAVKGSEGSAAGCAGSSGRKRRMEGQAAACSAGLLSPEGPSSPSGEHAALRAGAKHARTDGACSSSSATCSASADAVAADATAPAGGSCRAASCLAAPAAQPPPLPARLLLLGSEQLGRWQVGCCWQDGRVAFTSLAAYCVPGLAAAAAGGSGASASSNCHAGPVSAAAELSFIVPPADLVGPTAYPLDQLPDSLPGSGGGSCTALSAAHSARPSRPASAGSLYRAGSAASSLGKLQGMVVEEAAQRLRATQAQPGGLGGHRAPLGLGSTAQLQAAGAAVRGGGRMLPLLLTGGMDGSVCAWDLRSGSLGTQLLLAHPHTGEY